MYADNSEWEFQKYGRWSLEIAYVVAQELTFVALNDTMTFFYTDCVCGRQFRIQCLVQD